MDLGCGMQQCEFKVKRCILVPFLCSLVWACWLESCDRTTRKRWCDIVKWFLFSEQTNMLRQSIESQCKRCDFFCPIDLQKPILGRTPTVQIERTGRCQSLGLHCRKNILSCEGDCSPMSKTDITPGWTLGNIGNRKNHQHMQKCPFSMRHGQYFLNPIAVLLLVNRQSAFCQATPSMSTVRRPHRQHSAMR